MGCAARSGPGRVLLWTAVVLAVAGASLGAAPASAAADEEADGYFTDDDGSVHELALDALAARGVLAGIECGEGLICPHEPLKRWEMAVWLVRVLEGADPHPVDASRFVDVDVELWWAPFVERLFDLRVTVGCATEPARFCPDNAVTRAQMATFLKRAFALEPAPSAGFADIDPDGSHAANIDALAAAGITVGCGRDPLRYCPANSVTRAQMATFLARALGLIEVPPSIRYTAVGVGSGHACALRTDATVACWGSIYRDRTDAPDGSFSAIAVGSEHSCAIRSDGTVACWGSNQGGETDAPDGQFNAVSAGVTNASNLSHSCGLRVDATIACWGNNGFGQTDAPEGDFKAVAVGGTDSCGLRADATIVCWGNNGFGQTDAPEGDFKAVAVGAKHSCGLRTDGTITCWGTTREGQGHPPPGQFSSVSAGLMHSCGLRTGGTIVCWGESRAGEADAPRGQFTSVSAGSYRSCGVRPSGAIECWGYDYGEPSDVPRGQFSALATGLYHRCGLRIDGTVECWGQNNGGQEFPPGGRFKAVAVGFGHSCGIRVDGTMDCWGARFRGQADEPDGSFIDVAAGRDYSCGVRIDGTVECWGEVPSTFRQTIRGQFSSITADLAWMCGLRLNGSVACQGAPADPPAGQFSSISIGQGHGCGVHADGQVTCWGDNDFGQIDAPSGRFVAVAAGSRHSCGLRDDGMTVCWGDNSAGQVDAPGVQLKAVDASLWYSCGLNAGNGIVCWGGDVWADPAPVGVSRVRGPNQPDPRTCRPFAGSFLSPGFPLAKSVPSTSGRLRVAVLFVDFPGAEAINSAQQESLKGLTYVKRYLESSSYRKLRIDFVPLYRWLRAERSYSHYTASVARGPQQITQGINREAVRLADPDFDFSGVGTVMIVMPSSRFAGGNALGLVETEEGSTSTLRINASYGGSASNWGPTAVHELAHVLGLPDLYPYTVNRHFVPTIPPEGKRWRHVELGLMGLSAAVPVDDRDPSGFTYAGEMLAWSRWQLGWLDDDQIRCISDSTATVTLSPVSDPGDGIAMAAVPVSANELIVVESRRPIGYDEHAALGDGAVIVYTVDARTGSGDLPIKLAGDAGRGHTYESPILTVGESVTVRGYTITVIADDGDTHTVTISKRADDG